MCVCALQQAEPAVNLIVPGCVGSETEHLEVQVEITRARLRLEPALQVFGRVSGATVHHEDHCMNCTSQRFGNDHPLDKPLAINKTLALPAGPADLAIGNGGFG